MNVEFLVRWLAVIFTTGIIAAIVAHLVGFEATANFQGGVLIMGVVHWLSGAIFVMLVLNYGDKIKNEKKKL